MIMKRIIIRSLKILVPRSFFDFLKNLHLKYTYIKEYNYDYKRFIEFSGTNGSDTSVKLVADIIRYYHVVEKGLTMPETRLGFGRELILSLCSMCEEYKQIYNENDPQVNHAIGVINEYRTFHDSSNYILDDDVLIAIKVLNISGDELSHTSQTEISKQVYFQHQSNSFLQFSNSRRSVRNFGELNIPIDKLMQAIDLSKNAPSACNRQSWRTHVYTDSKQIKTILEIQGGNRGFGHLTNKLIVVTGELGGFGGIWERNQVFIDGGIYAMNLLYSLHFYEIATCILNCSTEFKKDQKLRELCKIDKSEVFIAMIACGIAPDSFKVAISKRSDVQTTNKIYS